MSAIGIVNMFETIEGNDIVLRKAKPNDYKSMLKHVWSNENIYKWMLFQPTFTEEEAIERTKRSYDFQQNHYAYFVALKETDEAIGMCAINEYEPNKWEECGIAIGEAFQGKGYGKEVVKLLLRLVFENLNGKSFKYGYFQNNIKSKKLAASLGFEYIETGEMIRQYTQEKFLVDYCILSLDKWKEKR